jgi:UDP-N-acetylmuramate dehydrogenase
MNLQKNVLLKNYSNYKIGGPAKFFVEITSTDDLKEALGLAKAQNFNLYILGGGTKVLIGDKGFDGLVIYNKIEGIEIEGNNLRVGSATLTKDILNYCIKNSLSGMEWAGGLPGTIGGAVRGNAGSFGGEIKDNIAKVESLDLKTLEEKIRNNEKCQFAYRNSLFKTNENSEFITYVILRFSPGNKEEIKKQIQEKIDYRRAHQPFEYPSIGSTFKNVPLDSLSQNQQKEFSSMVKNDPFPIVPATKLLALSGLKGKKVGGAMISDQHPNFILNVNNATAEDVKTLIELAKKTVKEKFNILLKEEIVYLN